jgi:RES domain-containing protein
MSSEQDTRATGAYDAAFLCFPMTAECACCGGSADLGGRSDPIPSPRGTALIYCSTECFDAWEEHLDEQDRLRAAAWCPTCGYDRHEHAPDCADHLAHLREQEERPDLYPTAPARPEASGGDR